MAVIASLATSAGSVSAQSTCPAVWGDHGNATFYDATGPNNCTLDVGNGLTAALSDADFGDSAHCGECLQVSGPQGTALVRVTDRCPDCAAGNLDLSATAFAAIADPNAGIVAVSWHRVDCPVSGNLAFQFQGSNPYYIKLQARNHRYGVASMELEDSATSSYQAMTRTTDNFFQLASPATPVSGSLTVRLTGTSGEKLVQTISGIDNSNIISGSAQFADCGLIFRDGFEG